MCADIIGAVRRDLEGELTHECRVLLSEGSLVGENGIAVKISRRSVGGAAISGLTGQTVVGCVRPGALSPSPEIAAPREHRTAFAIAVGRRAESIECGSGRASVADAIRVLGARPSFGYRSARRSRRRRRSLFNADYGLSAVGRELPCGAGAGRRIGQASGLEVFEIAFADDGSALVLEAGRITDLVRTALRGRRADLGALTAYAIQIGRRVAICVGRASSCPL